MGRYELIQMGGIEWHVKLVTWYIRAVTSHNSFECSFCDCVIPCAVRICRSAACESGKCPPVPVCPSLSALFGIFVELVLSTVLHTVYILCMY
jgi:hypothetical protein